MTISLSVALPPAPDSPELARVAEQLGYERAWFYDTPALQLDVWMAMALSAERTSTIGLGPAVIVPSLRHPLVTASAIGSLETLAAGRTAYAVGTGFTGRRALGLKPLKWADVVTYVRQVQALLRGDAIEYGGAMIAMIHGTTQAPPLPIEVPWLLGANGPKGLAAATEMGVGVFTTSPTAGFEWSALLSFGTVVDEGEDVTSGRVIEAAGPGAVVAYHALYEQKHPMLAQFPGASQWIEAIEQVPEPLRHLETHRGHLTELNPADRLVMTGELAVALSRSGNASAWRDRVAAAADAGTTEFVYQPAGPDPRREIEAFIAAVRG